MKPILTTLLVSIFSLSTLTFANPVKEEDQQILGTTSTLNLDRRGHCGGAFERSARDNTTIQWSYGKEKVARYLEKVGIKGDLGKEDGENDRIYVIVFDDDPSEGIEKVTLDRGMNRIYIDTAQKAGSHNLGAPRKGMKWTQFAVISVDPTKWTNQKINAIWKRSAIRNSSNQL